MFRIFACFNLAPSDLRSRSETAKFINPDEFPAETVSDGHALCMFNAFFVQQAVHTQRCSGPMQQCIRGVRADVGHIPLAVPCESQLAAASFRFAPSCCRARGFPMDTEVVECVLQMISVMFSLFGGMEVVPEMRAIHKVCLFRACWL